MHEQGFKPLPIGFKKGNDNGLDILLRGPNGEWGVLDAKGSKRISEANPFGALGRIKGHKLLQGTPEYNLDRVNGFIRYAARGAGKGRAPQDVIDEATDLRDAIRNQKAHSFVSIGRGSGSRLYEVSLPRGRDWIHLQPGHADWGRYVREHKTQRNGLFSGWI